MLINSKRRETEFAISPLQITQGDLNILRVCLCVIKIKITQFLKVGGLGTHVHPWRIHVDVWQNQYSIVKEKKVKLKIKKVGGIPSERQKQNKIRREFPFSSLSIQ